MKKEKVEPIVEEKVEPIIEESAPFKIIEQGLVYVALKNIKYGELEVKIGQEFDVADKDIKEFAEKGIIEE